MFAEKPAWSLLGEKHEKFKDCHDTSSDQCNLPILDANVMTVFIILNAKEIGNEDTDGDEELVTISKQTLQLS